MLVPVCRKHQRLKDFARARGVSLDKLVDEWATVALEQLHAENHYRLRHTRSTRGGPGAARYTRPHTPTPVGEKEGHGIVPTRAQESSGGRPYGNLFGKISPELSLSLIPWRSSRPNPFLDRRQSRVERVGVGTRHDPFQ
jgi:hypothetical protein